VTGPTGFTGPTGAGVQGVTGPTGPVNGGVTGPQSGWAATPWTGTPNKTARNADTATTQQVAQALKALLDDLKSAGVL